MMAVDLHNSDQLLLATSDSDQFMISPQEEVDGGSNSNSNKGMISSCLLVGSSDSGSDFSSSIGSELSCCSTESSEEEDDYIGELTRQMALNMLQDEDKHEKPWGFGGSSREPSPPLTPMIGSLEKLQIDEERGRFRSSIQESRRNPNTGFQSKQALIDDQIRAVQFNRLKQEQTMKQTDQIQKPRTKHYHQSKGKAFGGLKAAAQNCNNPWLTLKHQQQQQQQQQQSNQQTGSDMRAVFLDASSGSRPGSCGTGVFLPRGIGTPCDTRKKQGCATVLIPARVVQALKLHFEKTGVQPRFNLEQDARVSGRKNNGMYSQQKRQPRAVPAMNHQEIGLPQEWTY